MSLIVIVIIRTIIAFIFLLIITTILTKRVLSPNTYFDYIAIAILGTLSGNLAFNIKVRSIYFITSMVTTTIVIYLSSYISIKSTILRKYLAGKPTILIKEGKILESNMYRLRYSYDYLLQQLRQQHVFDINKVQSAILESNGLLSVQLKSKDSPLTPKDMNIYTVEENLVKVIILEGKLLNENLKSVHKDENWLNKELSKRKVDNIEDVSFGAVSSKGKLYLDFYEDNI
ncbi:DUF421 domain-containing protein [Clostridium sp. D2Q-11]|uniref:DUF421 domain-containing protein n=1 Tax=Anaeromonas frigoriresistens TaxID=2683708 RepID=A0A942Z5B9_9FIRM|nr:DUF421 domain-containing protein [Anaeromonas frigoriresistens]MBS4537261.1 DUF421 domain-containing protein [Anaeromonas frigoriresistens]